MDDSRAAHHALLGCASCQLSVHLLRWDMQPGIMLQLAWMTLMVVSKHVIINIHCQCEMQIDTVASVVLQFCLQIRLQGGQAWGSQRYIDTKVLRAYRQSGEHLNASHNL
jgi:hypothetical protein